VVVVVVEHTQAVVAREDSAPELVLRLQPELITPLRLARVALAG
jgi:hypothetical protein